MSAKQKVGCVFVILSLFVTWPIWYYLLFQILTAVNASDVASALQAGGAGTLTAVELL